MGLTISYIANHTIHTIPSEDLTNPTRMRWWDNLDTLGDDPVIEALAKTGWKRLANIQDPPIYKQWLLRYRAAKRQFLWDHPYVTACVYQVKYLTLSLRKGHYVGTGKSR